MKSRLGNVLMKLTALVFFVYLVLLAAFFFLPDRLMHQLLGTTATKYGLTIQANKLTTGFPFTIKAKDLSIGDYNGTWIRMDQVKLRLYLLPLFSGDLVAGISGHFSGSGTLEGYVGLNADTLTDLNIKHLSLNHIPYLTIATSGGKIQGTLEALAIEAQNTGKSVKGSCKGKIRAPAIEEVQIGSFPLPKLHFQEARFAAKIEQQRLTISSFSLESSETYLRLSGSMPLQAQTEMQMKLEMMPKPAFIKEQATVFMLLSPFQQVPGHYTIPIAGTPAAPRIEQ